MKVNFKCKAFSHRGRRKINHVWFPLNPKGRLKGDWTNKIHWSKCDKIEAVYFEERHIKNIDFHLIDDDDYILSGNPM